MRLSWWLRGKESAFQCRRHRLDPWAGKIPWRRRCSPTPVFLPGKSHGQSSLMGYSPRGHKGSETTVRLNNKRMNEWPDSSNQLLSDLSEFSDPGVLQRREVKVLLKATDSENSSAEPGHMYNWSP